MSQRETSGSCQTDAGAVGKPHMEYLKKKKTSVTVESRLPSNLQVYCLDFPITGITDVCHHAQQSLVVLEQIHLEELRAKSVHQLLVR